MTDLPSTDLSALLERVEKATGADRAVDWELHTIGGLYGVGAYGAHPHYTASLDAALGLVERVLPGTSVLSLTTPTAALVNLARDGRWYPQAEAKTAPLALIASLLSALIASEGGSSCTDRALRLRRRPATHNHSGKEDR